MYLACAPAAAHGCHAALPAPSRLARVKRKSCRLCLRAHFRRLFCLPPHLPPAPLPPYHISHYPWVRQMDGQGWACGAAAWRHGVGVGGRSLPSTVLHSSLVSRVAYYCLRTRERATVARLVSRGKRQQSAHFLYAASRNGLVALLRRLQTAAWTSWRRAAPPHLPPPLSQTPRAVGLPPGASIRYPLGRRLLRACRLEAACLALRRAPPPYACRAFLRAAGCLRALCLRFLVAFVRYLPRPAYLCLPALRTLRRLRACLPHAHLSVCCLPALHPLAGRAAVA